MSALLLQVNRRKLWFIVGQSALIAAVIVIAAAASARTAARFVTGDETMIAIAGALLIAAGAARMSVLRLRRRVGARERLLVVGSTDADVSLTRELVDKQPQLGIDIVGFVDVDLKCAARAPIDVDIVGTIDRVPDIVRHRRVDRVVVNLADGRGRLPVDELLDLRLRGIPVDHLASAYERYTGKIVLEHLRPSWFIFSSGFQQTRTLIAAKRLLDVVVGSCGLLLVAPLMGGIAVAVKLTSRGPVFYSQRRVGQNGQPFTIRKFRSMHVDAEATTGAVWAMVNDPRLTPIGRWLRSTRLDELPQLWNVLAGDMSLVGPRPERPEFVSDLEREITLYGRRHLVKPGITGWAQVSYPYGASVNDALQKLQYDLYYLKHMSIAFDMFIMLATLKTVWSRTGC